MATHCKETSQVSSFACNWLVFPNMSPAVLSADLIWNAIQLLCRRSACCLHSTEITTIFYREACQSICHSLWRIARIFALQIHRFTGKEPTAIHSMYLLCRSFDSWDHVKTKLSSQREGPGFPTPQGPCAGHKLAGIFWEYGFWSCLQGSPWQQSYSPRCASVLLWRWGNLHMSGKWGMKLSCMIGFRRACSEKAIYNLSALLSCQESHRAVLLVSARHSYIGNATL